MKLRDSMELVNINDITPFSKNAKKHSPEQIQKLAQIMDTLGFDQPLVIDELNVVIKGHARLECLKFLKQDKVPCIRVSGLSVAEKSALRLSDNKLQELSEWDDDLLTEELKKLLDAGLDIKGLGFEDITNLDNKTFDEKEFDENIELKNRCPKCGYEY